MHILVRYFLLGEGLQNLSNRFLRAPDSIERKIIELGFTGDGFFAAQEQELSRIQERYL